MEEGRDSIDSWSSSTENLLSSIKEELDLIRIYLVKER